MDGELEPRTDVEEGLTKEDEPMETTPPTELCSDGQRQETGVMTTEDCVKAPEENDDDVVLVEGPHFEEGKKAASPSSNPAPAETTDGAEPATTETASSNTPSPSSSTAAAPMAPKSQTEPIVIDDEEDSEQRDSSSSSLESSRTREALSSTEPDSEIKIASVTTLGVSCSSEVAMPTPEETTTTVLSEEESMNLKITSVTSLKGSEEAETGEEIEATENGLQISSTFSLNPEAQQSQGSGKPSPTFNPGRVNSAAQPVQNGETGTHQRSGNA